MTNRPVFLSFVVWVTVLAGAVVTLSAGSFQSAVPSPAPPGATEPLSPEDQAARTTFETVCGACHEAAVATTTLRTREEWNELVEMMVAFGATASEPQRDQIQRYLLGRYGRVNVNRAPADELRLVLGVSADAAQAIVDYRSTMRIATVDDLKNVAGLDAASIDRFKARLQF